MRFVFLTLSLLTLVQPSHAQDGRVLPELVEATPEDAEPAVIFEDLEPNATLPIEPVVLEVSTPDCPLPAPSGSSEFEVDVWNQICAWGNANGGGEVLVCGAGQDCPSDGETPVPVLENYLSQEFLTRILTKPDYVAARPSPVVRFANFENLALELSHQRIPGSIEIFGSRILRIDLSDTQIEGSFTIDNSVMLGRFAGNGLDVGRNFSAQHTSFGSDVWLDRATIGEYATFSNATIAGKLDAYGVTTGRGFFFEFGVAEHLDLRQSSIGGNLDFSGTFLYSKTETDDDGVVNTHSNGSEGSVYLYRADIGGNLDARGTDIRGQFSAAGITVDGDVWSDDAARFGEVDLGNASVNGSIDFRKSTVLGPFNVNSVRAANLDLDGATVSGLFDGEDIRLSGSIFFRDGASFAEVKLPFANIRNNLEASGSTFTGKFGLNDAEIGGNLWFHDGSSFNAVTLTRTQIGGSLSLNGATVAGEVSARSIRMGHDLFLTDGNFQEEVILSSAHVGGILQFDGSTFDGPIFGQQMQVHGATFLRNGSTFEYVTLIDSTFGSLVQLQGSRFNGQLDLSNTAMGTLQLWRGPTRDGRTPTQNAIWGPNASLILRNARAEALQAQMGGAPNSPDSWVLDDGSHSPLPRDLTGFRYDMLGGFTSDAENDLARVDEPDALLTWVSASRMPGMTGYRPQPYTALETALRNIGSQAAANEVAYERMKHRAETRVSASFVSNPWTWFKQVLTLVVDRLFQWTVGFGVYPHRAFGWFVGIVTFGAFLASPCLRNCAGEARRATIGDRIFYSLENAIPLMEPSSDFAGARSDNPWIRAWFNFSKISGFVLATVLIGVLTFGN